MTSERPKIPVGALDPIYLGELALQAEFALRAYGEIERRAAGGDLSIWAFIQLMLGSAANVSKLLFPAKDAPKEAQDRCERLRSKLSVPDDSPLAGRTARNYVDHFDERLDRYLGRIDGVLLHRLVLQGTATPTVRLDDGSEHPARYLLLFEAPTRSLVLLDDRLELRSLAEAILAVQRTAVAVQPELATRGWRLTCLAPSAPPHVDASPAGGGSPPFLGA